MRIASVALRALVASCALVTSVAVVASPALAGGKKARKRERILTREAHWGRDQTKVDFDAVDIDGAPKRPLGELVGSTRSSNDHDFVKIRTDWHAESVQSAAALDATAASR
jgi:hypothetical protein